jgi:hypothetical protein
LLGPAHLLFPFPLGAAQLIRTVTWFPSPRHIAPSVQVSRTTRSCAVRDKGYETGPTGATAELGLTSSQNLAALLKVERKQT